jgi:hypothetical protein
VVEKNHSGDHATIASTQGGGEAEAGQAPSSSPEYQKKGYFQKPENWIALGTLVAVVIYTGITALMWCVSNRQLAQVIESNKVQRLSQRAFVYLDKVVWRTVEKDTTPRVIAGGVQQVTKVVEIAIVLTNNGNTAAAITVDQTCPGSENPVPEPFTLFTWDDTMAIQQIIGPKQTIEIALCAELTDDDVARNAPGFILQYIVGEIRYHDLVEPNNNRFTQFAMQLRFFNEDLADLHGRAVAIGKHNCTEQNCPK